MGDTPALAPSLIHDATTTPAPTSELEKVGGDAPPSPNTGDDYDGDSIIYVHGVRFWLIAAVIAIVLFLASIDTTIATTSLVAITQELGEFESASWIFSSYLLGYVAVIVILAKFSDVFGRKLVMVSCIVALSVFSAGCAAAQTMTQLIILRAFQGVACGGGFALSLIMIIESVPPAKYGTYVANANLAPVLAYFLGPILGGAISENTTWRWIFWINVPIGVVALTLALVGIPNGFPYQERPRHRPTDIMSRKTLDRLDLPGCTLLLLATMAFTACFQEADSRFPWGSAYVITLLVVSVVLLTALLFWERYISLASRVREPVLPWRFMTNRVMVGVMFGFLLVGAPMTVTNFQLPQRFQLVNGLSSLDAGVRILPFGAAFPVGSVVASKIKIPGIYLVLLGSVLQIVGYALLSTMTASENVQPSVYGYQVICGLGCGLNYTTQYLMIAFVAEKEDKSVGMGIGNQLRMMGGAIGLAIATSVFNGYTVARLANLGILDPSLDLGASGQSSIPSTSHDEVRQILSEGYNRQMLLMCAIAAAEVPAALLLWKREQVMFQ